MTAPDLAEWFEGILERTEDHRQAIEQAYIELRNSGLLSKVTLHRYMCRRGCQIAVVFRVSNLTLCAVRDYKQSPGLNLRQSVPAARLEKTLDGDRHWPALVYDVGSLAGGFPVGAYVACRHYRGQLLADEVLALVADVRPGHPGPPTRL